MLWSPYCKGGDFQHLLYDPVLYCTLLYSTALNMSGTVYVHCTLCIHPCTGAVQAQLERNSVAWLPRITMLSCTVYSGQAQCLHNNCTLLAQYLHCTCTGHVLNICTIPAQYLHNTGAVQAQAVRATLTPSRDAHHASTPLNVVPPSHIVAVGEMDPHRIWTRSPSLESRFWAGVSRGEERQKSTKAAPTTRIRNHPHAHVPASRFENSPTQGNLYADPKCHTS